MPDALANSSSLILYQTEDGQTRVQCRFENETVWLTQKLMGELFQKDVRTINEHIQNVFAEGELLPESVIRKCRITRCNDTQRQLVSLAYRFKWKTGGTIRKCRIVRSRTACGSDD